MPPGVRRLVATGLLASKTEVSMSSRSIFSCRMWAYLYMQNLYILQLCWMAVKGFDWDLHNAGHVAQHGVNPIEVEETVARPHAIIPAKAVAGEKRWTLFGTSAAGRYLVVVFTIRDRRLRPVTAYTMNQRERRIYAPEIDKTP